LSSPKRGPSKAGTVASIFTAILLLAVLRVDWWWWGKAQPPILGWLTLPMLYHLAIWAAGWLLVILTVVFLWPDPQIPSRMEKK